MGEFRAVCVLNAVHRPEDLFDAVENDAVARFFSRMICRETAMLRWMPVPPRKNQLKLLLQFIGNRDDVIAMRDSQSAAGQEIFLKLNDDQRIHRSVLRVVILSEAKNLGSIFDRSSQTGIDQECFASLNMIAPFTRGLLVHFNWCRTRVINLDLSSCKDRSSPIL